jgi:hypothetical protein
MREYTGYAKEGESILWKRSQEDHTGMEFRLVY